MKVLIVFREDTDTDNLFVPILCSAIRAQGIDIQCSIQYFWETETVYDIIHFQWPEEVVGWNCNNLSTIERLQERIDYFKSKGSRIVYTRHNSCPHYGNGVINAAYEMIETHSDVIVHMGQCSCDEFKKKYPNSTNIIIPHHIYENTYNEAISCKEARLKLGIPSGRLVITSFGKFRNREEIFMVLKSFYKLKAKNKYLLAPRMFPFSKRPKQRSWLKRMSSLAGYHILIPLLNKILGMRTGSNEELIANEELPYYLAATDIVFVQRKQILNSGNIPLAFLFRKVALGPQTGNVGELLQQTKNPTFDVNDPESIIKALESAAILSRNGQGERNYQYAIEHFGLENIANKYKETYHIAIMKNNTSSSGK